MRIKFYLLLLMISLTSVPFKSKLILFYGTPDEEKLSNRNRTQPGKLNHFKKVIEKLPQLQTKRKWNWSKSQEKQKPHSQVFLDLIYFHWHKLMNNTFVNYFCITSFPLYFVGRWGVLLSRSTTILRSIKSSLISCPQLSIYAFSRLVFIKTC